MQGRRSAGQHTALRPRFGGLGEDKLVPEVLVEQLHADHEGADEAHAAFHRCRLGGSLEQEVRQKKKKVQLADVLAFGVFFFLPERVREREEKRQGEGRNARY